MGKLRVRKNRSSYTESINDFISKNKSYINTALDFVPVAGAINRAVQGDYPMAITNLLLDLTGPVKYGAKLLKLAKSPGGKRAINLMLQSNKIKRKEKIASTFLDKAASFKPNTYKEIGSITNNYKKSVRQLDNIKELRNTYKLKPSFAIKQIANRGVAEVLPISTENRKRLSLAVRNQSGPDATHGYLGDRFKRLIKDYITGDSYTSPVGKGFLLTDKEQKIFMESMGYKKTSDYDGIKMINKAVKGLLADTHRNSINMYQLGEDVIPRDSIYPIPKDSVPSELIELVPFTKLSLIEAGSYPTIYYKHKNPNKRDYYIRDIDLNDYGHHVNDGDYSYYGNYGDKLANIYDFIGNPFIQKTGIKYLGSYKNGGTIHTITRQPPIHVIRKAYEDGGDIKKDPYAPIKGYKTKGYDTETTQWLFDWLNNRRKILLNNYNNYGYALSKYTVKENKDIRDTKFERGKVNTMYNPIDYFRGYDPNRTKLNKILYTEIENAGSAPETNIPDNYGNMPVEPSYGTLGLYAEPDNWSGTGHYIAYLGYPSKTTKIHERTHAMNASPQHDAISKIITKSEDEYLDNPKEIYARLMQYRYNNELKPTDIIDKNYLNKNREKLKELELNRYNDEELIRLFNEVAQNDMNKNNLDAIRFYGKNGGTIHINPANRGKFNATKRRRGKTTEELTHSKNPKTRKRAIFAQNAAKWRKRG